MTTPATEAFREEFRRNNLSPSYSGPLHLSLTVGVTLAAMLASIAMLGRVQPLEWLTIPVTFLYGNLAEYLGHRGPMHHKTRLLALIYQRHAVEHHNFFTEEDTTFDSSRDYYAVLFPPIMLLFFFGCFALPVGVALYLLLTPNVAFLFILASAAYFLNYELLHFAYHMDEKSWVSRLPFIRVLRRHHTVHHDRRLMSRYNFNITYPIFDVIFGTVYRPGASATSTPAQHREPHDHARF